jgi:hypothetical protein
VTLRVCITCVVNRASSEIASGVSAEAFLVGISKHSPGRRVGVLRCTKRLILADSRAWEDDGCHGMSRWMQGSCQKNCPAEGSFMLVP